jgi:hypothetical protein
MSDEPREPNFYDTMMCDPLGDLTPVEGYWINHFQLKITASLIDPDKAIEFLKKKCGEKVMRHFRPKVKA